MCDFLDPNNWDLTTPERRIYLDERNLDLYAVVDEEDYVWAIQWHWKWKQSKRSTLIYALRCPRGSRAVVDGGVALTYYLHIEIMKRIDPDPPSDHILVDHRNGKSLICRRKNLRWSTVGMNTANRSGSAERELYV